MVQHFGLLEPIMGYKLPCHLQLRACPGPSSSSCMPICLTLKNCLGFRILLANMLVRCCGAEGKKNLAPNYCYTHIRLVPSLPRLSRGATTLSVSSLCSQPHELPSVKYFSSSHCDYHYMDDQCSLHCHSFR